MSAPLSQENRMLLEAAKRGDFNQVFVALAEGADPNCIDEESYGWTPLHFCAKGGDTRICKALLARSANLNARDRFGQTPLHRACFWGNLSVAQFLIEEGADYTLADYTSQRPDELAFYQNHLSIYQFILQIKTEQKRKEEQAKKNLNAQKQLQKEKKRLAEAEAKLTKKDTILANKIEAITSEILRHKSHVGWETEKKLRTKISKLEAELTKQRVKRDKLLLQLEAIQEAQQDKKGLERDTPPFHSPLERSNSLKSGFKKRGPVLSTYSLAEAPDSSISWKNWD